MSNTHVVDATSPNETAHAIPKPDTVSRVDRLELENLQLRVTNVILKKSAFVEEAKNNIAKFDEDLKALLRDVDRVKSNFSIVYGIDWNKQMIQGDTGLIIPIEGK